MSALSLRPSVTRPGTRVLTRRSHDLSGVAHEHVATLPEESAVALEEGGSLHVRLREEATRDQAPWILEVSDRDGRTLPGCFLSDTAFLTLIREPDRISVYYDERDMTGRDLQRARHDLEDAEAAVAAARDRIARLEARLAEASPDADQEPAP